MVRRLVEFVLVQFGRMGASQQELSEQRELLMQGKEEYREWCIDIHDWCDVSSTDSDPSKREEEPFSALEASSLPAQTEEAAFCAVP